MIKDMSDLRFHVHDDMEAIQSLVPMAYFYRHDKYIMQEDRIVYVGGSDDCISFMNRNNGERMEVDRMITLKHKPFAYQR